jgi:hypothetical protein
MTLWWTIVGAAGLFVAMILVLRALPPRPGNGGAGNAVRTGNPVHGVEGDGLPLWHHHHLNAGQGVEIDNVVSSDAGGVAGSSVEVGSGAGSDGGGRAGGD